jgi:hypothetical protein
MTSGMFRGVGVLAAIGAISIVLTLLALPFIVYRLIQHVRWVQ